MRISFLDGSLPDVADDGPRGHHEEEVGEHPVLRRVPEGVAELRVVLDRHGVDRPADLNVKSVTRKSRNLC